MTFSPSVIVDNWSIFAAGLLNTVIFCAVSSTIGLVVAVPIALARLSKKLWWRVPARVLVELIRDTPFLVQAFIIYFVLPAFGVPMSTTAAGIIALSLYGGVYFSESIRGAILSVPKGQVDAARATGMSYLLAMRKIVFPQMLGYAIPPLANQVIGLIKDSAVLSIIAVPELTMAFQNVLGTTFAAPETFLVVTVLYWALTSVVAFGLARLERLTPTHRSMRRPASLLAAADR
jgi:His/Glu/Gln/Arg/opine family amino acid ABC transporter permease subunit